MRSRAVNLAHDSKFKLGFCDNPKRLNVAISRAKQLLIIVGNGTLFGTYDRYWADLLAYPLEIYIIILLWNIFLKKKTLQSQQFVQRRPAYLGLQTQQQQQQQQ